MIMMMILQQQQYPQPPLSKKSYNNNIKVVSFFVLKIAVVAIIIVLLQQYELSSSLISFNLPSMIVVNAYQSSSLSISRTTTEGSVSRSNRCSSSSSSILSIHQQNMLWQLSMIQDVNDDDSSTDSNNLFDNINENSNESNEETEQQQQEQEQRKLGIPIILNPLSQDDATMIKAEATDVVNTIVASGIDELQLIRQQMIQDIQQTKMERDRTSQIQRNEQTQLLMNKIDTITNNFLQQTEISRTTTKLIANADQSNIGLDTTNPNMIQKSNGIDFGVWGTISGRSVGVTTSTTTTSSSSSSDNAISSNENDNSSTKTRMIVIADTNNDQYAKLLIQPLQKSLQQTLLASLSSSSSSTDENNINNDLFDMIIYKPTTTIPVGNIHNAVAILIFGTSINDVTTLQNILDRIYRTTINTATSNNNNKNIITSLPTQIIFISTIGTTRTNILPYSFQNMMSNNQLSKRLQMEEYIIKFIQQQQRTGNTGIDYTICHLGEIKTDNTINVPFQLVYGETIDSSNSKTDLAINTAVTVLTHTIALQPYARNTTLSCVGNLYIPSSAPLSSSSSSSSIDTILDDAFLKLHGPELVRYNELGTTNNEYDSLVQYISEWVKLIDTTTPSYTKIGLSTPVKHEIIPSSTTSTMYLPSNIIQQSSLIRLLFQPTNTGKYYMSKEDEKQRQQEDKQQTTTTSSSSSLRNMNSKSIKEGGVEFVVEKVIVEPQQEDNTKNTNFTIRVRVKRCNYNYDTIIKELSEKTILNELKKCIETWKKTK